MEQIDHVFMLPMLLQGGDNETTIRDVVDGILVNGV